METETYRWITVALGDQAQSFGEKFTVEMAEAAPFSPESSW